jgi:hypothetical protein
MDKSNTKPSTYLIVTQPGGVFDVEVAAHHPMTVRNFTTQVAAEMWIADHKGRLPQTSLASPKALKRSGPTKVKTLASDGLADLSDHEEPD